MTVNYRNDFEDFFKSLCIEASSSIKKYFGNSFQIENKEDSSPVTIADKSTEEILRKKIEKEFPQHGIVGEEFGTGGNENSEFQWILDPIDGTKSFIAGVPLFGTLIALVENGKPVVGCIHMPILNQTLLGYNEHGTFLNDEPTNVSNCNHLEKSILSTTCIKDANHILKSPFAELISKVKYARTWGDCYGHFLVATGKIDIMIDPILSKWDIAALKPCIIGAGGSFYDLNGPSDGLGSQAFSSNPLLMDQVLKVLNQ